MINTSIIHPTILGSLASAGHKSTILVADAYFASSTTTGPHATTVLLNLEPGRPTITRVVELIAGMTPIEKRTSMASPAGDFDGIQDELDEILGTDIPHEVTTREQFYALTRSDDLALCIVTGDTRRFGNILLTVGTEPPASRITA